MDQVTQMLVPFDVDLEGAGFSGHDEFALIGDTQDVLHKANQMQKHIAAIREEGISVQSIEIPLESDQCFVVDKEHAPVIQNDLVLMIDAADNCMRFALNGANHIQTHSFTVAQLKQALYCCDQNGVGMLDLSDHQSLHDWLQEQSTPLVALLIKEIEDDPSTYQVSPEDSAAIQAAYDDFNVAWTYEAADNDEQIPDFDVFAYALKKANAEYQLSQQVNTRQQGLEPGA